MKFILLEREIVNIPAAAFQPHLEAEALHVWQLTQQGVIRESYFNADEHTAVLVLECDSKAQVEDMIAGFPLVKAGLITFDILPLKPYEGFARLFDKKYQ